MIFNTKIQIPLPSGTCQPITDLNVPNYDRRNDRGNYLVASLKGGEVTFSSYCASFSRALAMTQLYKRHPVWVLHGLEEELLRLSHTCGIRANWLNTDMVDKLLKTQLGKTIDIVTTFNV